MASKRWVSGGDWKGDIGEMGGVTTDWSPQNKAVEKEEAVNGLTALREGELGEDYRVSFT